VYRFSAESLRRARDLGWDADEILDTLAERSSTPIPQPLSYLVRDMERRPPDSGQPTDGLHLHLPPERALARVRTDDLTAADRVDSAAAARIVAVLRRSADEVERPVEESERRAAADITVDGPLSVLREAVETGETVWFGYVDGTGASGERLVTARSVDDGMLEAEDARSHEPVQMPVRRITTAHIIRTNP
jgi:hypothetical protein